MGATATVPGYPAVAVSDQAELHRVEASKRLDPETRSALGQFLTPSGVARLMAALFGRLSGEVRLLDAGAGVGSLLAAADDACGRTPRPSRIEAAGFELDVVLGGYLGRTIQACGARCAAAGVRFDGEVIGGDFVEAAVHMLDARIGGRSAGRRFSHAILNPPYRKLTSHSRDRLLLRRAGVETSNLYAGFVALAVQLLEPGGEMVAITPRSFCNGPYFRPFRELLFREVALRRIHLFESRTAAFSADEVLQENVIFHVVKGQRQGSVLVSSSEGPADDMRSIRDVPFDRIVREGDPEIFIHLVPDDAGQSIADAFGGLPSTLPEMGVQVSTGKVVDFRVKPFLRMEPSDRTQPLIYPTHFDHGIVRWPKEGKKPNGLVDAPGTRELWMPSETYVVTKRFSSKEERRRVVAAMYDPEVIVANKVAFENHLNVFHRRKRGLDPAFARGLAAFLNSTFVDTYFRQFSGHTQVNATDLRNLRYPTETILKTLGRRIGTTHCSQQQLDAEVETVLGLVSA
jgi:adenine-specific DNA-methyltransferase